MMKNEKMFGFDCPKCRHKNLLIGEAKKAKGKIYKCEKCGEKILMNNLVEC